MKKLIEALQIFLKYGDKDYPTHCEHDELTVDYKKAGMSQEDVIKLEELGFHYSDENECFYSYKYGSC